MTSAAQTARHMVVVAAALVDRAGHVCLQQRPAGKQHGGLWEFPGGKVEPGEDPGRALCREIAEELGLVLDPADLVPIGFAGSDRLVILLYACRRWQGMPRCIEGQAIVWCEPSQLAARRMPPLDYPLAEQLRRVLSGHAI